MDNVERVIVDRWVESRRQPDTEVCKSISHNSFPMTSSLYNTHATGPLSTQLIYLGTKLHPTGRQQVLLNYLDRISIQVRI